MKISNFDRATARVLREEMNQAFKSIEVKYGITLSAGNISFSNNEASIKVKANTIGDNGQVETKEARNWGLYADHNGLGDLKVGDTIDLQGKSFTIKGWNTRARKSPIQIEDAQGRGYKCSVSMVKMYNRELIG